MFASIFSADVASEPKTANGIITHAQRAAVFGKEYLI